MQHSPRSLGHIIAELKRRRVFRVVAAYAVVAWIATQVTATVAPALHLPGWTVTFVVLLAILGFPVAAILSWAYDITPDGVRRTPAASEIDAQQATPVAPGPYRRPLAVALIALLVVAAGWAGWRLRPAAAEIDTSLIAVLPFRVSADPSLDYLREGMLDLVVTRLDGMTGAAVVDPRSLLRAWNAAAGSDGANLGLDEAITVARSVGAGRVLVGEIVSMPPRLALAARLVDARSGDVVYRADVEGAADSLPSLVDRLVARLLLVQAGVGEHRLEALTSTSLPALREYMHGQALFRRGRIEEALDRFMAALEYDSTFAHAALAAASAQSWGIERADAQRVQRLAWDGRDRLSERDRLHLLALVGPDYPAHSSAIDLFAAAQRAVSAAPDRPELWYHFGDVLTHDGARLGIADWREQAIAAFVRADELGLMSGEAVVHLIDLLVDAGDREAAHRRAAAFLAENRDGEVGSYIRWLLAAADGLGTPDERLAGVPWRINRWIVQNAQLLGPGYEKDVERAALLLRRQAQPPAERASTLRAEIGLLLNAGRPAAAERSLAALGDLIGRERPSLADRWRIQHALYWDGSADHAERAAAAIAARVAGPTADDADARQVRLFELCTLEQWRVVSGRFDDAAATVRTLRDAAPPLDSNGIRYARICAAVLEALLAEARGTAVRAAADRLEVELTEHMPFFSFDMLYATAPLVLARLREAHGDIDGALAAARRRPGAGSTQHVMLSTYLREEARLAARAGQRDAAVRAWTHYLALRADAEPVMAPEIDRARNELEALLRDARS